MATADEKFLSGLTQALVVVHAKGKPISTIDFITVCERILPVFDHLGSVFVFAKNEMSSKKDSIIKVAATHTTLDQIIDADKVAGVTTKKNSCARNLHRLTSVITFVQRLLEKLCESSTSTLRDAASVAYEEVMAPFHTYVVRAGVRAGLLALPSKETFLASIGETLETAKGHSDEFIVAAKSVTPDILQLYHVEMPASDVWFWSSA
jgi:hypothetical protein